MFEWLRAKVRNAVLAGVNDAVGVLQAQADEVPDEQQRLLEDRVKLLPPPPAKVDKRPR